MLVIMAFPLFFSPGAEFGPNGPMSSANPVLGGRKCCLSIPTCGMDLYIMMITIKFLQGGFVTITCFEARGNSLPN